MEQADGLTLPTGNHLPYVEQQPAANPARSELDTSNVRPYKSVSHRTVAVIS